MKKTLMICITLNLFTISFADKSTNHYEYNFNIGDSQIKESRYGKEIKIKLPEDDSRSSRYKQRKSEVRIYQNKRGTKLRINSELGNINFNIK